MKKKLSFFAAIFAATLLISACSSEQSTSSSEQNKGDVEEPVIIETENEEPAEETGKVIEEPINETAPDSSDEDLVNEGVPEGSHSSELPTQTTDSEVRSEQGFTMEILANYTFSPEEPGKDIVFPGKSSENYMRIETSDEEDSYDYFLESTLSYLEASSNGETPAEMLDKSSLPNGEEVKAYTTEAGGHVLSGIVYKQGERTIRLTVFDTKDHQHFNAFMTMASTIK